MRPDNRLVIIAFMLAGLVSGIYAAFFLSVARKIQTAIVSRKVGAHVEDWLKGLG